MTRKDLEKANELEKKLKWCIKDAQTIIDMQNVPKEYYRKLRFDFTTETSYYSFQDSSKRTAEALVETILMFLYTQTQKELREAQKEFDEFTGSKGNSSNEK